MDTKTRSQVVNALPEYRWILHAYEPVDVAFKIVGTGSVRTRDYAVLLFGRGAEDPLILPVKEELPSCYASYLRRPAKHEGRRVAEGQQRIQTVADPFLGYTTIDGRDLLVRQLSDHQASIDLANLRGKALLEYAVVYGEVLAKVTRAPVTPVRSRVIAETRACWIGPWQNLPRLTPIRPKATSRSSKKQSQIAECVWH